MKHLAWMGSLLAVGVLAAAVYSCAPSKVACLASNCTGCCDTDGNCQIGLDDNACGTNAATCQVCVPGSSCQQGTCSGGDGGTCGPSTCSGCCDSSGSCQSPGFGAGSNSACGINGAACAACAGSQTCNALGVCQAAGPCGPGSCAGCCAGNTCVLTAKQTTQQCGSTTGGACVQCPGGDSCQAGACHAADGGSACGPGTCQGCCSGTQCVPTASETGQHCGSNAGATCTSCPNGCNNGACNTSGPSFAQDPTASSSGAVTLDKEANLNASTGSAPATAAVTVTAYVTPHGSAQALALVWTSNNFTSSSNVPMTLSSTSGGNDLYTGSLPAQAAGTTVRFYFDLTPWSGTDMFSPGNYVNFTYVTH